MELKEIQKQILAGIHPQFVLDREKERVMCKCGHTAIFWRTGYICGTITAYICKYSKQ